MVVMHGRHAVPLSDILNHDHARAAVENEAHDGVGVELGDDGVVAPVAARREIDARRRGDAEVRSTCAAVRAAAEAASWLAGGCSRARGPTRP